MGDFSLVWVDYLGNEWFFSGMSGLSRKWMVFLWYGWVISEIKAFSLVWVDYLGNERFFSGMGGLSRKEFPYFTLFLNVSMVFQSSAMVLCHM